MIYKTRGIVLKDGRSAILRAPRESDAEEMLEYLRTASGETEFLASYPEELKFTAEGERAYLKNNLDSPNTMMLVCDVDGKIAGNSQIVFMSSLKTRHRAGGEVDLHVVFGKMNDILCAAVLPGVLLHALIRAAKYKNHF